MKHTKIFLLACSFLFVCLNVIGSAAANFVEFEPLPGSKELPAAVQAEIQRVWLKKPIDYDLRTKYLRNDGTPTYANRLLLELSPYLNQHAHTPINWFAWGEDAFAEAKERDVPIFLSIGYSSCHWCHVMEAESFDSIEIAQLINQHFVAIKVDREVNPDVDEIHLLAMQVLGFNGGWPLNMFLTPDGKPVIGMTYVTPEDLVKALGQIVYSRKTNKQQVQDFGNQVSQIVRDFGFQSDEPVAIGMPQVMEVINQVVAKQQAIDNEFAAPENRFPSEAELFLLLDSAFRYRNVDATSMAFRRLDDMANGGIRDHVGGGFHRYTIDSQWQIPHFEKMLYNQALIARAYLYAYQFTGINQYRRVAKQTLDYVLREMTGEQGNFYSATDADSGGIEGEYFLWTPNDVKEATPENAELVISHYGISEKGNFEGKNVLTVNATSEARSLELGLTVQEYLHRLDESLQLMREYRDRREKPFLDRKTITAWNGLMITTLSEASLILQDERYLEAATKAAEFILERNLQSNGHLHRIYFEGISTESGKLRDYAYMLQAMISLYDHTQNDLWLEHSEALTETMFELFWDDESGGFYLTALDDSEHLFARFKDRFDEAIPSGNAVAAHSLAGLYYRTGKQAYSNRLKHVVGAFAHEILQFPTSFPYLLAALDELRHGSIGGLDYAGSGNVRVVSKVVANEASGKRIIVELDLADGWHVQSNTSMGENAYPTEISINSEEWEIAEIQYPPAELLVSSFQDDPLSVWSNQIRIPLKLQGLGDLNWPPELNIHLQACDKKTCLLPEIVQIEIPTTLVTD